MKTFLLPIGLLFSVASTSAQSFAAPGYSKEKSLYEAKEYIITQVLGPSEKPIVFESSALSAADSGELTALFYKCIERQKEGVLLSFWGHRITPEGTPYQSYGFKNLPHDQAVELMGKLQLVIKSAPNTLQSEEGNVYFQYDDLTFLVFNSPLGSPIMRVFWKGFDSEWNIDSFNRTKRRMEKKI